MLTAIHSGDLVYGIDLTIWSGDQPPLKIESTASIGYIDIGSDDIKTGNNVPGISKPDTSPIVNWNRFGKGLGYDTDYIRDRIKALYVNTLDTYTQEEKEVFLEHLLEPIADLEEEFGFSEVVKAGVPHLVERRAVRGKRLDVAAMTLRATVGESQADLVFGALSQYNDVFNYLHANHTGIKDFINSTGNYVGSGLLDMSLTPLASADLTISELQSEAEKILYEGTNRNGDPYD